MTTVIPNEVSETSRINSGYDSPGGVLPEDEVLIGAIDLHHHGYPESSLKEGSRYDLADALRINRAAGMAGIVLKSHFFPTVGMAYHLNREVEGITVFPSITLDPTAGGFNPVSVECAALLGAKVIWMPTWGAEYDIKLNAVIDMFRPVVPRLVDYVPGTGLVALDSAGKLKTEVAECLAVAAQYGMLVCTGHLDPNESIVLADRAKDYGIDEVVFTHPYSVCTRATPEQVRDMQQLGALYEFCGLALLPQKQQVSLQMIAEIVDQYSADKVILSTDTYFSYAPSASETLRMIIAGLLGKGMPRESVEKLVKGNPRRLLKLDGGAAA